MTRKEFDKRVKELEDRGYVRSFGNDPIDSIQGDGTNYYYKVLDRYVSDDGNRAACILMFKIWNLSMYPNASEEYAWSLEPVVTVSRVVDERIDLHIDFPKHSVDYLEKKAHEFYEWCCQNMEY